MLELGFILCMIGASYLAWKAGRDHKCDKCFREGFERGAILGAAIKGKLNATIVKTPMGASDFGDT